LLGCTPVRLELEELLPSENRQETKHNQDYWSECRRLGKEPRSSEFTIDLGCHVISLPTPSSIMSTINLYPDSFMLSDG
jgi:hypothetical protein